MASSRWYLPLQDSCGCLCIVVAGFVCLLIVLNNVGCFCPGLEGSGKDMGSSHGYGLVRVCNWIKVGVSVKVKVRVWVSFRARVRSNDMVKVNVRFGCGLG